MVSLTRVHSGLSLPIHPPQRPCAHPARHLPAALRAAHRPGGPGARANDLGAQGRRDPCPALQAGPWAQGAGTLLSLRVRLPVIGAETGEGGAAWGEPEALLPRTARVWVCEASGAVMGAPGN